MARSDRSRSRRLLTAGIVRGPYVARNGRSSGMSTRSTGHGARVPTYASGMGDGGRAGAFSRREFVKRGAAVSALAMGGRLLGPLPAQPARAQSAAGAGAL